MTRTYTTLDGVILSERENGVTKTYVSDPQGSVIGVLDESGNELYSATYWPYGEIRTETGTRPAFGFLGALGYMRDFIQLLYVRARYLRTDLGRWMTVDPLWPGEAAYGYADGRPSEQSDPLGLMPCRTTNGACGVFICDMFDLGPLFPSHTYMCVKGPHGGCAGGISMWGHEDETQCCESGPSGNGITVCRKIATDCDLASIVCECIREGRSIPTGYWITGLCWNYPGRLLFCACEKYRHKYGRYRREINCNLITPADTAPYYDGKLVPIPNS